MKNENQASQKFDSVLSKFNKSQTEKDKYVCPAHDDGTASLSITESSDNKILLHCHAGCNTKSILDAVGLTFKDLYLDEHKGKQLIDFYDFTDPKGVLAHREYRYLDKGKKKFVQSGFKGSQEVWSLKGIKLYPYNLVAVLKAQPDYDDIYIVEGGKDAKNLIKRGLIATTSPMGAGKWKKSYNEYFRNQNVVIIPDNDDAGINHAKDIINNLQDVAFSIKLIELDGLNPKEDVSDWLKNHTVEELKIIVANTQTYLEKIKSEKKIEKVVEEVSKSREIDEIQEIIYTDDNKLNGYNVLIELGKRHQLCTSLIKGKRRYFIYKDGYWQDITADEVSHLFFHWLRPMSVRPSIIDNVTKSLHSFPRFNVHESKFNAIPNLVNLKNCAFNLDTFKPEPHNPEHYFTYKTDYDFSINADCPEFKKSIKMYSMTKSKKVIEGWSDLFFEIAGYCLRGDYPFQKMFWFTGSKGRNGKGTCVRIIESLVGDQFTVSDLDPRDLRERFYKTRLMGKRLATSGDLHNRLANVATLKQLTGGDRQTSDVKFGDAITFTNHSKLIFAMNQLPSLPENENIIPIAKRIVILPFEAEIEKPDAGIENIFMSELSGIFNLAIAGLKRLMINREFTVTDKGIQILDMYSKKIPTSERFLLDNFYTHDGDRRGVYVYQIWEMYQSFMKEIFGGDNWRTDNSVEIRNSYNLSDYVKKYYASEGIFLQTEKKYSPDKGTTQSFFPKLGLLSEKDDKVF
ncbi:MAG: hypothetical protein KGZ71_08905 [Desulfobulbaceae bacterium]|nr:hypothetical protein [Desulfobulbaceae bacterium]